ncbi:MAG: c-type cytochrome, partial [Burkholderiales bacterium]|nr:c-type cytochrome [Burkholderiales bacterium]
AAWDIDVRPDFKGLPVGSGSVAQGQHIWEAKCASCHGVFGESNQVFSPLVGGTTEQDVRTGRVARLTDSAYPSRTTLMKVATLSTLWDYINRAMPWNQPKSLSANEVYAVTAYMLNLGNVLPDGFTLSDQNMVEVQARMPNRLGMTAAHALWPGREFGPAAKPDTPGSNCLRNCTTEVMVASALPDFARNQHGNLAEQNRQVGPQRGADTSQAELKPGTSVGAAKTVLAALAAPAAATEKTPGSAANAVNVKAALALATKNSCTACHGVAQKIVGPSFAEIAKKYPGQVDYLATKIRAGGAGLWGPIPMPAQSLSDADAKTIAAWLATGAAKP